MLNLETLTRQVLSRGLISLALGFKQDCSDCGGENRRQSAKDGADFLGDYYITSDPEAFPSAAGMSESYISLTRVWAPYRRQQGTNIANVCCSQVRAGFNLEIFVF